MANDVFANGREVSCKMADGKSICAFPDVCMTPPENPATPPGVPVPYPNTGLSKDTTKGSKNVKISGKEVMLKNKSYFKKSIGNEAGSAAKKGFVTSVNRGKVYFISWSMDVKFEGKNVVRHFDMTTHNHGSPISNTGCWIFTDRAEIAKMVDECTEQLKVVEDACEDYLIKRGKNKGDYKCPCKSQADNVLKKIENKDNNITTKLLKNKKFREQNNKGDWVLNKEGKKQPEYEKANKLINKSFENYASCMKKDECAQKSRCLLTTKEPSRCCKPQTPHHIVPKSQFEGIEWIYPKYGIPGKSGFGDKAPCICAEGYSHSQGSHKGLHAKTNEKTIDRFEMPDKPWSGRERWPVTEAEKVGVEAVNEEFNLNCEKGCLLAQVRKQHEELGISENELIKPSTMGPGSKRELKWV